MFKPICNQSSKEFFIHLSDFFIPKFTKFVLLMKLHDHFNFHDLQCKLSSFSHSSIKTIIYVKYFPAL